MAAFGCVLACGRDESKVTTGSQPVEDSAGTPGTNAGTATSNVEETSPVLLIVGDSITAGFGLAKDQAYPALLQQKFDEAGIAVRVVNGGESGRTTSGGESAMTWYLKRRVDILVIALGGNDALRAVSPSVVEKNLESMIEQARGKYPSVKVVIAGMRAPPQLGPDYLRDFERAYPEVARRHDATLIPFLLEGVAADPDLNQSDGIHPTAEGQKIIADHFYPVLAKLLESGG